LAAGLVAVDVEYAGERLIGFPGSQTRVAEVLERVGIRAELVNTLGMVSVVDPDGSVSRQLVPRSEVDDVVIELHAQRHGRSGGRNHLIATPKRRSGQSDMLIGSRTES
jgi:hypothetical protein